MHIRHFRISAAFHQRLCSISQATHQAHLQGGDLLMGRRTHWGAWYIEKMVTMAPVLGCPDPKKQYFLEVDTLAFALGTILFQYDDQKKRRDVAYFSKALTLLERNYNIWDWEFLAIVTALRHWCHLLVGTMEPVIVLTDHANLQYYCHPQKINRRVARYINFLEDFHYQLKHILGMHNHADALSQRSDHECRDLLVMLQHSSS